MKRKRRQKNQKIQKKGLEIQVVPRDPDADGYTPPAPAHPAYSGILQSVVAGPIRFEFSGKKWLRVITPLEFEWMDEPQDPNAGEPASDSPK